MAVVPESVTRSYRHTPPKRRAKYAPAKGRVVPGAVYFDKKDATPEKVVRALRRNGIVIIRKLATAKVIDQCRADLQPSQPQSRTTRTEQFAWRTTRAAFGPSR